MEGSFHEKVMGLFLEAAPIDGMDELKMRLKQHGMGLSLNIMTCGLSNIEWNVGNGEVSGVVNLYLRAKIFDLSNPQECFVGANLTPIHMDQPDPFESGGLEKVIVKAVLENTEYLSVGVRQEERVC